MPVPIPGPEVGSDSQKVKFLMIFGRPVTAAMSSIVITIMSRRLILAPKRCRGAEALLWRRNHKKQGMEAQRSRDIKKTSRRCEILDR